MTDPKELYEKIDALEKSILPNESKANNIRKLFEEFLHSILETDPTERHASLNDLIDEFALQENRHGDCNIQQKTL